MNSSKPVQNVKRNENINEDENDNYGFTEDDLNYNGLEPLEISLEDIQEIRAEELAELAEISEEMRKLHDLLNYKPARSF